VIEDTGVGMTREQLINELGTVARSGTSSFIEAFEKNADVSLIGQFGVGFYSVYLVADTVTVTSKHPDSPIAYTWESTADQTFSIREETNDAEVPKRGTRITLHLKEDASEYLDVSKVKEVIKRHSQFINHPIYLLVEKEVEITESEAGELPCFSFIYLLIIIYHSYF
jgi:molecular chaperone HtpG